MAMEIRNSFVAKKQRNSIVLLTGAPGIGKSWSALYYIRLLAEQKEPRPILYELGKQEKRVRLIFVPPKQDGENEKWVCYSVEKSSISDFPGSDMLEREELDVVIDPVQDSAGVMAPPSPLISADGHVFVPKFPNAKYPGAHRKNVGDLKEIVINPCSLSSILEIQEPMGFKNVKEEDVRLRFYRFGGLPRYIYREQQASERWKQMNEAGDKKDDLLSALTTQNLSKSVIQSCFFAWRMPNGFGVCSEKNPGQVGFVSLGAIEKGGRIIMEGLNKDTVWKNSANSSAVGLAFEYVILAFLKKGDAGMKSLGVQVKCRKLLDPSKKSETGKKKIKTFGDEVSFSLAASDETIENIIYQKKQMTETFSEVEFYKQVVASKDLANDGLVVAENGDITCYARLTLAPVGHAVSDAMCGRRVLFNTTLQKSHSIKGAAYLQQRQKLGLDDSMKSIMVFVVPQHRYYEEFKNRQLFDWLGEDVTTETDKSRARQSLDQYVLVVSQREVETDEKTDSMEEE